MAGVIETTEVKGSYPVRCSHLLCTQSTCCKFFKNTALFYKLVFKRNAHLNYFTATFYFTVSFILKAR